MGTKKYPASTNGLKELAHTLQNSESFIEGNIADFPVGCYAIKSVVEERAIIRFILDAPIVDSGCGYTRFVFGAKPMEFRFYRHLC